MKRIHYGWYICFAATMMLFTSMGMGSNGFSIFMPLIMDAHDLTNAQTSSLVTIRNLVSFCSMFLTGIYYEKVGTRIGTTLAVLSAAASYLCYSISTTYSMFCVGAAIAGLSFGLGTMIPAAILINQWFVRHRAMALAICGAGTGVAMIILPPISTWLVELIGLSGAFRVEGIFVIAVAVLVFFIVRGTPAQLQMKPLGAEDAEVPEREEEVGRQKENEPMLQKNIWLLLIFASMLTGAVASPGFAHLSVLFSTAGFDSMYIAAMISGIGILLTAGKLLYGHMTDRIGGYRSSLIFWLFVIAGHVLCCLVYLHSNLINILIAVILGIGYALTNLSTSVWAGDMVSGEQYSRLIRHLQIASSGGALLFSNVPGILADYSGNYISTYVMFTSFSMIAAISMAASYRLRKIT